MSRMLHDTEFFRSRISKIDGAGDIGHYLVNIVYAKAVAEQPKPPEEPPPAKPEEPAESVPEPDAEDKS